MEITPLRLEQILITAAELGAKQVIDSLGLEKKQVTRNEAYRLYGRKRVDLWFSEDLVKRTRQGRRTYYNKLDLEKQSSINRLMERCFGEE
nr:hypothetical protein [Sunxiuqinia sp.]